MAGPQQDARQPGVRGARVPRRSGPRRPRGHGVRFQRAEGLFCPRGAAGQAVAGGTSDKDGKPLVQLDRESFQRIVEWLDVNAVCYGDYSWNKPEWREPSPDGERASASNPPQLRAAGGGATLCGPGQRRAARGEPHPPGAAGRRSRRLGPVPGNRLARHGRSWLPRNAAAGPGRHLARSGPRHRRHLRPPGSLPVRLLLGPPAERTGRSRRAVGRAALKDAVCCRRPIPVQRTASRGSDLAVATVAEITSRIPATTLLASVEPCSEPELGPPRDLFGHHAACQRGAVFRTRARPAPRPLRPPRCLPAWSRVQNQSSARPATSSATTLLASVEPCSEPELAPPRDLFGHHAACQRGAVFRTRARPAPRPLRPPRCLPAWSRVQNQSSARPATSSATTLLASVGPCSEPELGPPRDLFGHHAACQRGAVFRTRARPAPRPLRPPRCLPAWGHVPD